jgi:hypothetical protein
MLRRCRSNGWGDPSTIVKRDYDCEPWRFTQCNGTGERFNDGGWS